jgi:glutamate-1-semialdehyde 2,1-aminomutase
MERIAPAGDVYQAGTLSGNPLAVAAGLATLAQLDAAAYARVNAVTERLAGGLAEAAADAGREEFSVQSVPGLVTPFFRAPVPVNYAEAQQTDQAAYGAFCRELLARGVYPPPSQFEAWFPSTAHTDADVDRTVEAAAESLRQL